MDRFIETKSFELGCSGTINPSAVCGTITSCFGRPRSSWCEQALAVLEFAEAEAVALLCCAALELPGVECCRGYIQSWWGAGNPIPERSAQRILKACSKPCSD